MYHSADVEKLARGEAIASESFFAILSDPAAVAQVAAQRELRLLLDEAREQPNPSPQDAAQPSQPSGEMADGPCQQLPPSEPEVQVNMDVTWEELALYAEDQLRDPARVVAVRRFLERHFPEAVLDPASLVANERLRYRGEGELS